MRLNLERLKEMDANMTIGGLISKIETKNKEKEEKDTLIRKTVIDHYTGRYLMSKDTNHLFGVSLILYKIDSIKSVGYNTDFEPIFAITGSKIRFSKRDLSKHQVNGETSDTFNYKDLQAFTAISAEKYEEYNDEYKRITSTLNGLIS